MVGLKIINILLAKKLIGWDNKTLTTILNQ